MPLTIAIGYKSKGPASEPEVLYCGLDATAAAVLVENPPTGIIRTELIKSPPVQRRRFWPDNVAPTSDVVDEDDDPQAPLDVEPPEGTGLVGLASSQPAAEDPADSPTAPAKKRTRAK